MSPPPYSPPSEEEWERVHREFSAYKSAFIEVANEIGLKGETWQTAEVLQKVKEMKNRLHCLRIAVGV